MFEEQFTDQQFSGVVSWLRQWLLHYCQLPWRPIALKFVLYCIESLKIISNEIVVLKRTV